MSNGAQDFFRLWRFQHCLSSAYFPQSNGRAEVAVKMTKRLLRENTSSDGTLDSDKLVRALLQCRNTPDRESKLSPSEILFGRILPDSMPHLAKDVPIFGNQMICGQWHQAWAAKEQAIKSRLIKSCEHLEQGSRELPSLREGDQVLVQNQNKSNPRFKKWDQQGTIIALDGNDQCLIKIHGSGRVTLRNRRFVKKFNSLSGFNTKPELQMLNKVTSQSVCSKNVDPVSQPVSEGEQFPVNEHISPGELQPQPSTFPEESNSQDVLTTRKGPGRPRKEKHQPPWLRRRVSSTAPENIQDVANEDESPSDPMSYDLAEDIQMQRKSTRKRCQRLVYDPVSGVSVTPSS